MIKILIIPLLCLTLNTCQNKAASKHKNSEPNSKEVADKLKQSDRKIWQLHSTHTGRTNISKTGEEMDFQETITLKKSGEFIKEQVRNGKAQAANGNYAFEQLEDGKYLVLTYNSKNGLIQSCTGGLQEHLRFKSETQLKGTANACDRLGMSYKLKE